MVIFTVVPLAMVAYFAFTTNSGEFTFSNLTRAAEYMPVLLRSVWYALAACAICLVIGYPVAYVIAQTTARTQRVLYLLVTLPMCMSFLLRTLAWVALLRDTGIINTFLGIFGIGPLPLIRNAGSVILGMVYNYLPYMIMPLYTVIVKLDPRLIEAAQDLGCDNFQVFRRVILPLSVPGIVSGITMVFVPAVSTFYISQKLGGTNNTMIGDVIELQFKGSLNRNFGAAMSLVLMVLVFISIWLMNRFTDDEEGVATI
jgi:spermidine/putrescine transport system permease protein